MKKTLTSIGLAVSLGLFSPAAADTYTLNAFAPLVVTGDHSVVTDDGIAKIAGTINGPLYIESDGEQVESGTVSCKFTLSVNTDTTDEQGVGTCKITFDDGAVVRADTSCKGIAGKGCDGDFRVTDGTGRFEGASGVGPVTFKTRNKGYRLGADGNLTEIIFGVARWDDFKINLKD